MMSQGYNVVFLALEIECFLFNCYNNRISNVVAREGIDALVNLIFYLL